MLKILEKNWVRTKIGSSSRRLRERGIALSRKWRTDIFFTTRVKIILFHVASVIFVILVTALLMKHLEHITLVAFLNLLDSVLMGEGGSETVLTDLNSAVFSAKAFVFGVIIIVATVSGFIATRLALRPARSALIAQRRFIASIAHELRTPLAVLRVQNEVAKLGEDKRSRLYKTLTENVKEINTLTEILNNLLLFNRVDAEESISFETVDLHVVLSAVIKKLTPLAKKHSIDILYAEEDIPKVIGNRTALEQAFFNLLKNAIVYSLPKGRVEIRVSSTSDESVTISIRDHGVGIKRDELPHVFEPFYRTENSSVSPEGSGLGLAIVFEIVKLHTGMIQIDSTEGAGTYIEVTLPLRNNMSRAMRSNDGISFDFSKRG